MSSCEHLLGRGRRAANKQRTRDALSSAAIALVAEEGIDALTAERIAEAAGVSRRTLFNYFPRVEDVLTASIEQVTTDTLAAFVARPADEPLRRSVVAVLEQLGTPYAAVDILPTRASARSCRRSPTGRRSRSSSTRASWSAAATS